MFYGSIQPNALTAQFPDNAVQSSRPSENWVFVRPNPHEPGRGHIVVYNWLLGTDVQVNLTSLGLRTGARFDVRDVMDYFGTPVLTGTYDGKPVRLPLGARAVAKPVGDVPTPTHTLPEFGVFVVTPAEARPRG